MTTIFCQETFSGWLAKFLTFFVVSVNFETPREIPGSKDFLIINKTDKIDESGSLLAVFF